MDSSAILIKKTIDQLVKLGVFNGINYSSNLPDEPKMHRFNLSLSIKKDLTDGNLNSSNGSGFSFSSRKLALIKCLIESTERTLNTIYKKSDLVFSSYKSLLDQGQNPLDPTLFGIDKSSQNLSFGWVLGKELISYKSFLIPAQAIFYNYKRQKNEPHLTTQISTGAAGGLDYESTLLRGIYEIIERDAFMTAYLLKIKLPKVDLNQLKDSKIQKLLKIAKKYNLEIVVFDITSDLKIPSFLTILLDKTGLGPTISLGLKSSLFYKTAILGSIEESFHPRLWIRRLITDNKSNNYQYDYNTLSSVSDRGLLWTSPNMLKHLDFLFDQKAKPVSYQLINLTPRQELSKIITILKEKNLPTFFVDLNLPEFKKLGLCFYKVTIPKLQPLYLNEKHKEIRTDRINQVAAYFNLKTLTLNPIPHPFL